MPLMYVCCNASNWGAVLWTVLAFKIQFTIEDEFQLYFQETVTFQLTLWRRSWRSWTTSWPTRTWTTSSKRSTRTDQELSILTVIFKAISYYFKIFFLLFKNISLLFLTILIIFAFLNIVFELLLIQYNMICDNVIFKQFEKVQTHSLF